MKKRLSTYIAAIFLVALCLIALPTANASDANKSKATVTFSKDVAPIFYNKCVQCHRAGEIAPMSLVSYKEARPWARSIKEKVASREMPPWHADPHVGEFANDRRMSQGEVTELIFKQQDQVLKCKRIAKPASAAGGN